MGNFISRTKEQPLQFTNFQEFFLILLLLLFFLVFVLEVALGNKCKMVSIEMLVGIG